MPLLGLLSLVGSQLAAAWKAVSQGLSSKVRPNILITCWLSCCSLHKPDKTNLRLWALGRLHDACPPTHVCPVESALSGSERALEFTMCNPPFFSSLEGIFHSTSTFPPRQVWEGLFLLTPGTYYYGRLSFHDQASVSPHAVQTSGRTRRMVVWTSSSRRGASWLSSRQWSGTAYSCGTGWGHRNDITYRLIMKQACYTYRELIHHIQLSRTALLYLS